MLTTKLTACALDWHVGRAMGFNVTVREGFLRLPTIEASCKDYFGQWAAVIWMPSSTWHQGGPIIEQEMRDHGFDLWTTHGMNDYAATYERGLPDSYIYGPTPLIAAMRCFVASKFGKEVEVPNGL